MDVDALLAFIESLQMAGVEEFEGFGFKLKFASTCFSKDRIAAPAPEGEVLDRGEPEPVVHNPWTTPNLWPGGTPPKFPGSE